MLGLLIWNVIIFWPAKHPEVQIPYSTFLKQISADNVAHVDHAVDPYVAEGLTVLGVPKLLAQSPFSRSRNPVPVKS